FFFFFQAEDGIRDLIVTGVQTCALPIFIAGFGSTKTAEASRNLALGRLMLIDIFGQIAALICMLGWTWVDRSIWALVAGSICWSLILTLLSHIWLPGTANRWQWDPSAFRDIFHFGKWIFVSSVFSFLA